MASKTKKKAVTENDLGKAISHPLRSEILTILSARTASPKEMADELDDTIGNVNYHVEQLLKYGCAEMVRHRPARGATEHFYRATVRNFLSLADAQDLHPAVADHYAGQVMQEVLGDFKSAAAANTLQTQGDLELTHDVYTLDEEGRKRVLEIHDRARIECEKEAAKSATRLNEIEASGDQSFPMSSSHLCFDLPTQGS